MSSSSLASEEFCFKLQTLASRHELMKITYRELKSQINSCLLEAHENFVSLAIPLMKLVGLKSEELSQEGRFNTIIIDVGSSHRVESQSSDEQDYPVAASQGENCATRATMAGRELVEKQQRNLAQLVNLLRQIEKHVNCQQDDILENLGKYRLYLHKYFHKVNSCVLSLNSQNKDTSFVTQKILQDIFQNVNAVLGSLENGVNDLIEGLAEKMCNPMVEYVKGLTDDMKKGTSRKILATLKEMEQMMRKGQLELEDAKKKARVAEEGKMEAICKLKAIEGRVNEMKSQLSLPEPQRRRLDALGSATRFKCSKEQEKDDKLLWKLLTDKAKDNMQRSPMGPEGLLLVNTNNKRCVRLSTEHTPDTRSRAGALSLQTLDSNNNKRCIRPSSVQTRVKGRKAAALGLQTPQLNNNWIPLGSSPSICNKTR